LKEQVLQKLSPFQNRTDILLHDQEVSDIITGILSTHDRYKSEYDKICLFFAGGSVNDICNRIWQFLKDNVKYVVESDERQYLKSPSAILATGKTTGSDCKNYSLFTGGVIDALNRKGYKIPFCYRFSSYRPWERTPQHVFVVVNPATKNEIWVDAVLPKFNWHKQYYFFIDKKPLMALMALSGIDDEHTIEGIGGRKKRQERKAKRQAKRQAKRTAKKKNPKRKKFFQKAKEKLKKFGKFQLKFALAPSRNSFLAIVGLNVRSLATRMKLAMQKDEAGLKKFWENIGGNYQKLKNTIEKGARKKRLGEAEIGALPAIGAAIVAATPLILKIASFLKKLGIKSEDLKKAAGSVAKGLVKKAKGNIDKEAAGEETGSGDAVEASGDQIEASGEEGGGEEGGGEEGGGEEASGEEASEEEAAESDSEESGEEEGSGEGVGRMRFPVPNRGKMPMGRKVLKPMKNLMQQRMNMKKRMLLNMALKLKAANPNKYPSLRSYITEAKGIVNKRGGWAASSNKTNRFAAGNNMDKIGDII